MPSPIDLTHIKQIDEPSSDSVGAKLGSLYPSPPLKASVHVDVGTVSVCTTEPAEDSSTIVGCPVAVEYMTMILLGLNAAENAPEAQHVATSQRSMAQRLSKFKLKAI